MREFFNFLGIFLIVVSMILTSCEKDDDIDLGNNTCNVSNPAQELSWLEEAIDNVKQDEYSYYVMAKYKGETVFYYGNCNPAANYVSFIHNCSGDNLGETNEFQDELSDRTTIWKHEETKCNF